MKNNQQQDTSEGKKPNTKLVEFNREILLCLSSFEADTEIKERKQNLSWDKNRHQLPDFFWWLPG